MLVIITEDSKSGLEFWNYLKKIITNNSLNVKVVSARPKNHIDFGGNNKNYGGIGNVKNELNKQLDILKQIPGKHMILLAIDLVSQNLNSGNLITMNNLIRYISDLKQNKIIKYKNICNDINIEYSKYYCYEEIFLSFKKLMLFCDLKNSQANDAVKAKNMYYVVWKFLKSRNDLLRKSNGKIITYTDYLEKLNNNYSILSIQKGSYLDFLYNKYKKVHNLSLKDMRNREIVASLMLEYITSINKKIDLKINKEKIGKCWFNDCFYPFDLKNRDKNLKNNSNLNCNVCQLCKYYKSGSNKMGILLRDSLFVDTGNISIFSLLSYI